MTWDQKLTKWILDKDSKRAKKFVDEALETFKSRNREHLFRLKSYGWTPETFFQYNEITDPEDQYYIREAWPTS